MRDSSQIKRKCGCCGEEFYIGKKNIGNAIYYDKKTYHSSCFTDLCEAKMKNKRRDVVQRWTAILNGLNSIQQKSFEHFNTAIIKEEIYEFIKEEYDITIVPTTVWQKIGNIYAGTFKGMSEGIPPHHLLDMWERKIDMLNATADKNKTRGKSMSVEQRLNYDLSILVNKYDSYLKWLEKQKIIEAENKKAVENRKTEISVSVINAKANEGSLQQKNDDMSDLVDDIFED